jgi:predicted ribosome quality control (RQC) complex YloA/Tae2 family protein
VKEIGADIIGKYVKNIYQIDDDKFIISYKSDVNKQLFIEVPHRLHLTQYNYEKPKFPPPFCVSLKKHLKERKIVDFYQVQHLDRIVVMELLDATGQRLKLVLEFYSKGNLVLLKPDGTVLIAKRYFRLKNEQILPNKPYSFPEQNFTDIFEASPEYITNAFSNEELPAGKFIAGKFNINMLYVEELLARAGIDGSVPSKDLTEDQATTFLNELLKFKAELDENRFSPQIVASDDAFLKMETVEPFNLTKFKDKQVKKFDTFNHAVDEYFSRDLIKEGSKKDAEKKKVSKSERILNSQIEQVDNLKMLAHDHTEIGNLIYQQFAPLTKLLETVLAARKQGMAWEDIVSRIDIGKQKGVEEALLFDSADPSKPFINVKLDDKIIQLDLRYSLTENVNKYYYDKSKKAKKKLPGAKETIERFKKIVEEEKEKDIKKKDEQTQKFKRRKREWFEKFRWFYSSNGYLVIGGRDATSNETIVAKYMKPGDLFFHSDKPGAPVVVIRNDRETPSSDIPMQTLLEAATFGIGYSSAWKLAVNAADIYSVLPEQVSKTPPTGESLPKGSFIIRGERQYFKNVKLEISIGLKFIKGMLNHDVLNEKLDLSGLEITDGVDAYENERDSRIVYPAIIGGPLIAIKEQADYFVVLKPSRDGENAGVIASEIKKIFTGKIDERYKKVIAPVDIEEIQAWIPTGKSSLQAPILDIRSS